MFAIRHICAKLHKYGSNFFSFVYSFKPVFLHIEEISRYIICTSNSRLIIQSHCTVICTLDLKDDERVAKEI